MANFDMKFSDFDFFELEFSTRSSIFETVDSPNSLVVLIFKTPDILMHPLIISSPHFASLGTLSPVSALVFNVDEPSTITPSIGTFSPGCTTITEPIATSAAAIKALKKAGIKGTIMLTGDSRTVADSVAAELGIDEVYSELLPGDKVAKVEELLARKGSKEKLAFVGDGINDAPVLSRADIGIAMGAMGSDAAIEAADIVLMDDDPLKIAKAIKISRKCLRIVYENTYFAIGIKLICLVLGAVGIANMWLAIFADVGVMVIAVLNAIRALFVHKL